MLQFKNLSSSELSRELNIVRRDLSYEFIDKEKAQFIYKYIIEDKQLPDYHFLEVIDETGKTRFKKKSRVATSVCSSFVEFKNKKRKVNFLKIKI